MSSIWQTGPSETLSAFAESVRYYGKLRSHRHFWHYTDAEFGWLPITAPNFPEILEGFVSHAELQRGGERRDQNALSDLSLSAPLRDIKEAYEALFELKARGVSQ